MSTTSQAMDKGANASSTAAVLAELNQAQERAKRIVKPGQLLIGGKWVPAESGKTFPVYNPATKEKLTDVADGQAEDVDRAVASARKALESKAWRSFSPRERGKLLLRIAELVIRDAEDLALLETLNKGKVINDSRSMDVPLTVDTFRYYSGWADKIFGETVPVSGDFLNYTLREPVGVVAAIIPWNFPMLLMAWKLAPALACGCTLVVKPAEQTPLTAIRMGQILQEAGVPDGVVNIITGFGPTAGAPLARHMDVDKVSFTGSTEVGKQIMIAAGQSNLKRVSLELGGKSPNIVFADANLPAAVEGAAAGVYLNQGEICHAGSRLFIETKIHDKFVEDLVSLSKGKKVGNPLRTDSQQGAQVSDEQFQKILGYIESGKQAGARLECGGSPADVPDCNGYFVQPTVFTGVKNDMKIAREEIFGPVISVIRFKEIEEVVAAANATNYGLAAGVWSKDIQKAHRVAHALRAGTVWINAYNAFDVGSLWGGYKESGIGRELGKHALELYTELKSVWVQL